MRPTPEDIELQLLLEAIYRCYGYDFRDYAPASLRRRILKKMDEYQFRNLSEMQHVLLHDPGIFGDIFQSLSITTTEMFRDVDFYRSFRRLVLPNIRHLPQCRIWHAGCATGEEVYSTAIMLQEAGVYDRSLIYATDINQKALAVAKSGIYPANRMQQYTRNYQQSGGKLPFSNFYSAKENVAIMEAGLRKNIVFSNHNLVTDSSFAEFNLIFCRNVLIYFNETLQNRVIHLLSDSLPSGGILCLGAVESLYFSENAHQFVPLERNGRIHQKK